MKFVELDRAFAPIDNRAEAALDLGPAWGRRFGGWLSWEELLRHRRVVVLAEALSGKTREFEERAAILRREGRAGFFVRIEDLADSDLKPTLRPEEAVVFERWAAGTEEAWFFLDSVDEARLSGKRFESALRKLNRAIPASHRGRTHVLVSCRVTDWAGAKDARSIESELPIPQSPAQTASPPSPDSMLLDPIFHREERQPAPTAQGAAPEDAEKLLVVQIAPLSDAQRRALAGASGIGGPEAFVKAINRHGLEALADRPGDLLELAGYWAAHGRFGSFAEMIEAGIIRKLAELDPFRPDNDVLTVTQARAGAERLAAALTLGKSFTLRAPGHDPDPTLAAGAIEPDGLLPDWTTAQRNALLRRGIFAPATYGRIRFHHRSTQEYLTAQWIERLLEAGCPMAELFPVIFVDRYSVETVPPSLRAVAAWLALRHVEICDEIVRRDPLTLLRHGDPSQLPIETKKRLLGAFATRHAAGEVSDESLDRRSLWMFGDPSLADSIRGAWHQNEREEFRRVLLRLIHEAVVGGCVDLARGVATDGNVNDSLRITAVEAMAACDDRDGLGEIAAALLRDPERVSPQVAARFAGVLFPRHLTVAQLLEVVDGSSPPREHTVEGFAYSIDELWAACPGSAEREELMAGIADLCLRPPYVAEYRRVSLRHQELARHLRPVARRAVIVFGTGPPPEPLIRLLMAVERADPYSSAFGDNEMPVLETLVRTNPTLHRALFWRDIEDERQHRTDDRRLVRYQQIHFTGPRIWEPGASDLPWLWEDLASRTDDDDRRIAFSAIVDVLVRAGQFEAELPSIQLRVFDDAALKRDLDGYLAPREEDEATLEDRRRSELRKSDLERDEEANKESWLKFRDELRANPSRLSDPLVLGAWPGSARLWDLTRWLRARMGEDAAGAAVQWRLLNEVFGQAVAESYRDGMKLMWRLVEPERPKREGSQVTTNRTNTLAFAGLAIEAAEEHEWAARLTSADACRAARHGCMAEEGYPEWIDGLVSEHPEVVAPVIKKELESEWSERSWPSRFLDRYGIPRTVLSPQIERVLYEVVTELEPRDLNTMDRGLGILERVRIDEGRRKRLRALGLRRFHRHRARGDDEWSLRSLALLFIADPILATRLLHGWLEGVAHPLGGPLAARALGALFGRHDPSVAGTLPAAPVEVLKSLVLLAYQRVRHDEDNVHHGTYTPDARDDAEGARNELLRALFDRNGAEAYAAMRRLSDHPELSTSAHRLREISREMAERDAEIPAWTIAQVLAFERDRIAPANTGDDLFRITLGVLDSIQFDFENADASTRSLVGKAEDEDALQEWLAEQLKLRARDRFLAQREVKVARGNKPDITVVSTAAPCQVAIEVKHGGKGWTVRALEQALRWQLAEHYLKPEQRRHGVLVITHHGRRTWRHPATRRSMNFSDLIDYLTQIASDILRNTAGPVRVAVRGIDASPTNRGHTGKARKRN